MSSPDRSGHVPVLVDRVTEFLVTDPGGSYLDLTVGAAGHLKALSERLDPGARLYGLDRDPAAVVAAEATLRDCRQPVTLVNASYSDIESVAADLDDRYFDGILLDLGLSSLQLDDPTRGFSYRFDGPLDMRFDPESGDPSAADLANTLTERELAEIIRTYGEERRAKRLAKAIVKERQAEMILTTSQLTLVVDSVVPRHERNKTLARVFQAFRIAANRELEGLGDTLPVLVGLLRQGGRLAVISYHSLEDRIVKRFFQAEVKGCVCAPEVPVCVCGHEPRLKIHTRRPVVPEAAEVGMNPRARSAKLRVAERLGG